MTHSVALEKVKQYAREMNARYGKVVFDEWAIISLKHGHERMVGYLGPRREDFQKNFSTDLGSLRAELLTTRHSIGHFDFARHGTGTTFEAFVCVGDDLYLICNNTQRTMDEIAKEERWLEAQKTFAELTDQFQTSPVAVQ